MTLDTIEKVVLVCTFIIPGFISNAIIKLLCPQEKRSDTITLLYCLFYSLLNIACFSWLYILILPLQDKDTGLFLFVCALCSIVLSVLIGFIIGFAKSKSFLNKIASFFKLNMSGQIPTAWDYLFSQQFPCFVIIILNSGEKVYGLYGTNSYSSSSSEERDIYIEKLYTVDDQNVWHETPNSLGILLNTSIIKSIEFLNGGNTNEN